MESITDSTSGESMTCGAEGSKGRLALQHPWRSRHDKAAIVLD